MAAIIFVSYNTGSGKPVVNGSHENGFKKFLSFSCYAPVGGTTTASDVSRSITPTVPKHFW